ncbi:hypothetical protein RUMCAL_00832 [Ruminococcus callidus ATCC 27760]|uniref:Uncharacterized protein n=1 Tax=Ruminococcus callidus ATCC 27760 TaxID=411473 RepID=U2MBW5_9FIRM|nr:hypothetical protein RUMCAL_00832 [Ruminococcus callidus ATCC 27760]
MIPPIFDTSFRNVLIRFVQSAIYYSVFLAKYLQYFMNKQE